MSALEPFRVAMRHAFRNWFNGNQQAIEAATEVFLTDRDERFAPGNDKIWGLGNWVRCERCLDSLGYPSYHSRAYHEERVE